MKIDFLELTNFRNIQTQKISFKDKNFVALIGDNGSGKTAILESITKGFVPILRTVNSAAMKECDLANTDIRSGTNSSIITLGITLDGEQYVWTNKKRLSAQQPYDNSVEQKDTDVKGEKELKIKYPHCAKEGKLPLVLYYGTDRIIREVPQRGHIKDFKISDALWYCFDNVNYFRDFYDWFKTEEDIELRGLRTNPQYKNPKLSCVRDAIGRMIKGYSNLRIELAPSRMVMTNEEGTDLRIDQLSGGYKEVLSVTADIAKRLSIANPDSPDPLNEEAVILIDELDLHLHPKWQKRILKDLMDIFPKVQFIVSTHAPEVINSVKKGSVVILRNNEVINATDETYGKDANTILREVMEVSSRPDIIRFLFEKFYELLDSGEWKMAEEIIGQLEKEIGNNDPEINACRVRLELKQM